MSDPKKPSFDAALQQAAAHHNAGQLPEAEKLYRMILAAQPRHAEANHNLGVLAAHQGDPERGLPHLKAALEANPGHSHYWLSYAAVLQAAGRPQDALAMLDLAKQQGLSGPAFDAQRARIVTGTGTDAGAPYTAALRHHQSGRIGDAVTLYRKALAAEPGRWEVLINLGIALTTLGQLDEAVACLDDAIRRQPDNAQAHNNLGNARERQGQWDKAAAAYRRALALAPDYGDAHYNLGNVLLQQGNHDLAIASYQRALAADPNHADALFNLGNIFLHQGQPEAAAGMYRRVLAIRGDFARAHYNLGLALCQDDHIAEGFACFMRQAELVYGQGLPPGGDTQSPHKAQHDREQRDYLAGGTAPDSAPSIDAIFHLADGERLATPAVDPGNAADVMERWARNPQVVVVDNVLVPQALDRLRRFCRESTVWRKAHGDGYLIAAPEHGFATPLLAQIAEELREIFPTILQAHPFQHLAGFKGDRTQTGATLHADNAAVNVNIWITPDEANLDPQSGGMVVWNVTAPPERELAKFNGDSVAIRDYLIASGARPLTIPYRANRAVIFDSDLIHETDKMTFRDGYTNRRINVTLLYGRREL